MDKAELFEPHKREDCEAHLLQTIKAEVQKLWDRTVVYFDQARKLETRRHPDTHEEIDYELRLRELEGQLNDRELRGVRMGNYHEDGEKKSWKDWILGLVALVILAWLGKIDLKMDKLTEVVVRQDDQGKELAELRCTVYKICP
jgi:hypothetical protein